MAPGHDFHLQLPRHGVGLGLSLGSCRNKQASLRRAPSLAGRGGSARAGGGARRELQGRAGGGARAGARGVTDGRGRAGGVPRRGPSLALGGRGPSRARAAASFRRGGGRSGRGGVVRPGPTRLASAAKARPHRAAPRPPLLAFLLPSKWRPPGCGEASIARRSAPFAAEKRNSRSGDRGGGAGKGGGSWAAGEGEPGLIHRVRAAG